MNERKVFLENSSNACETERLPHFYQNIKRMWSEFIVDREIALFTDKFNFSSAQLSCFRIENNLFCLFLSRNSTALNDSLNCLCVDWNTLFTCYVSNFFLASLWNHLNQSPNLFFFLFLLTVFLLTVKIKVSGRFTHPLVMRARGCLKKRLEANSFGRNFEVNSHLQRCEKSGVKWAWGGERVCRDFRTFARALES